MIKWINRTGIFLNLFTVIPTIVVRIFIVRISSLFLIFLIFVFIKKFNIVI